MRYDPPMTPAPEHRQTRWGLIWLACSMLVVPSVLVTANLLAGSPLSDSLLNVIYYCTNFFVTVLLFRKFLALSVKQALDMPLRVIWFAILGYLGYLTLTDLLTRVIFVIYPSFSNVNDANISTMLTHDTIPLAVATVFLVPVAEETLYRGLIFRKLYDRSKPLAYAVSMVVFAAIHVTGYIGYYSPALLALCFLQYLPAAYCLCWCYCRTGTIVCPILMHTLVNGISILTLLR